MKLLITLADIAALTTFSRNIDAHLVTPAIRDAHTFDVKLPAAVRADLEAALPGIDPAFQPEEVAAADFATAAAAAGWASVPLAKAWYEAIRPLLVMESARRLLLGHGLHITPNGVENTSGQPASPQERAALRADYQAKAMHYRAFYEASLRTLLPAAAPAGCGTSPTRRPGNGGFRSAAL